MEDDASSCVLLLQVSLLEGLELPVVLEASVQSLLDTMPQWGRRDREECITDFSILLDVNVNVDLDDNGLAYLAGYR